MADFLVGGCMIIKKDANKKKSILLLACNGHYSNSVECYK